MMGILGNCGTFPETIDLISSGRLVVDSMVTRRIDLDRIVPDGFEALLGAKDHVKILVRPS